MPKEWKGGGEHPRKTVARAKKELAQLKSQGVPARDTHRQRLEELIKRLKPFA